MDKHSGENNLLFFSLLCKGVQGKKVPSPFIFARSSRSYAQTFYEKKISHFTYNPFLNFNDEM